MGAPEPTDEVTQQGALPGAQTQEAKGRAEEGEKMQTQSVPRAHCPRQLPEEAVSPWMGKTRKLLPRVAGALALGRKQRGPAQDEGRGRVSGNWLRLWVCHQAMTLGSSLGTPRTHSWYLTR